MAVCCSPALTLIYSAPDLDRSVSIIMAMSFGLLLLFRYFTLQLIFIVFNHFLFTRYLSSLTESGTE